MHDDTTTTEAPTRRDIVKYGGAAAGAGLLAGCTGDGGDQSGGGESPTETEDSYTVTMSPAGEVTFDAVPERAVTFDDTWLDHMVALGQADKLVGIARPDSPYLGFYDELPGVSVDTSDLTAIYGEDAIDKEALYELEPDVLHLDPIQATNNGLDEADVEELTENLAPFLANRFSLYNQFDGDREYEFYTLWELSEKLATAYQVPDRSTALQSVYDGMVADIEANLPAEDERPTVALTGYFKETFYAQPPLNSAGYGRVQYRPAGAKDAYEGYPDHQEFGGQHDIELMLEIDPDIIVSANSLEFPDLIDPLKNGEIDGAEKLTAVQNDRVYNGSYAFQGPVLALFQTEMFVKQVYPERFGAWPGIGEPVPEDEQLFDRQEVADIINGDI